MTEFTFDIKLFATVRVTADSEDRARELLREYADCLDIGLVFSSKNQSIEPGEELHFTEASMDGEPDLVEDVPKSRAAQLNVLLATFGFEPLQVLDAHTGWVASYPVEADTDDTWGVTWSEGYVEDLPAPNGWYLCHATDGHVDAELEPMSLEDALTLACQRNAG